MTAGLVILLVLAGWIWSAWRGPREPVYSGKYLSEWLLPTDPGFVWLPTDVYGHIHDEMWDKLIALGKPPVVSQDSTQSSSTVSAQFAAIAPDDRRPNLGPEAIPWLVRWMEAQPSAMDHLVTRAAPWLPLAARQFLSRFDDRPWTGRAGRWQVAAHEGFVILRTNAVSAVPALARLMEREDAELPLALSLIDLGSEGTQVVVHALEGPSSSRRDTAALALGMSESRDAIPALLRCVEDGHAGYHVLGAIGRIEPVQPRLVVPLIHVLESSSNSNVRENDQMMTILLLGLQGATASNALPVLTRLHAALSSDEANAERRLLRRVIRSISPDAERRLPPPGPRDDSDEWP